MTPVSGEARPEARQNYNLVPRVSHLTLWTRLTKLSFQMSESPPGRGVGEYSNITAWILFITNVWMIMIRQSCVPAIKKVLLLSLYLLHQDSLVSLLFLLEFYFTVAMLCSPSQRKGSVCVLPCSSHMNLGHFCCSSHRNMSISYFSLPSILKLVKNSKTLTIHYFYDHI